MKRKGGMFMMLSWKYVGIEIKKNEEYFLMFVI